MKLTIPIETDYAIFLFDNGEKNMVASMLKYVEEHGGCILLIRNTKARCQTALAAFKCRHSLNHL